MDNWWRQKFEHDLLDPSNYYRAFHGLLSYPTRILSPVELLFFCPNDAEISYHDAINLCAACKKNILEESKIEK